MFLLLHAIIRVIAVNANDIEFARMAVWSLKFYGGQFTLFPKCL